MYTPNELRERNLTSGKCRVFSWSAVIVGTLIGLGVSFLLNLFGVSIGLAAFKTTTSATTFAIGGFLALIVISIVSMATLGYVAGYLGAVKKLSCNTDTLHCNYGCLYGFTAWSLALILTVLLSAHVGKFINYTVASLSNPTYVLHEPLPSKNPIISPAQSAVASVSSPEATKQLALTTFISFVLFSIGAFAATLAGHLAFERCTRKHGVKIE